jgi:hypothetical protein
VEVEADGVAHPAGDDLHAAAVEVHAPDVRVLVRVRIADVARGADRHVELAVGPDLDELPAVRDLARELIVDHDRRRQLVEVLLDVGVAGDLLRRGHVERALVVFDAVRQEELLGERLHLALAATVDDGVELAGHEQRAHEHRPLVALTKPAGVEDLGRVHLDLEAVRHLHLGDRQLVGRCRHRERGHRRHLRARAALGPPDRPERRFFLLLLRERRQREEREHQAGDADRQYPRR